MAWYQDPTGYGAMLPDSVYPGSPQEPPPPMDYQYGLPPEVLAQVQGQPSAPPPMSGGGLGGPALNAGIDAAMQRTMGQAPDKPLPPIVPARTDTKIGGMIDQPPEALQHEDTHGLPPEVYAQVTGQSPNDGSPGFLAGIANGARDLMTSTPQPQPQTAPQQPTAPPQSLGQQAWNETMGGMDQSAEAQQGAFKVQEAQADENAQIKKEDYAAAEALRQKAERDRAAEAAVSLKQHQDLGNAIDARNAMTIDPNRKWNNMGTGQKVMAGIGVLLSGIGQALSGHGNDPNLGLKVIHDAIKEDVDNQMRDRDVASQNIEGLKQKIGSYDDVMKTEDGQRNALMADHWESVAQRLDAASAQYTSPLLKQRALDAAGQARQFKGQYMGAAVAADSMARQQAAEKAEKAREKAVEEENKRLDREQRDLANRREVGLGYSRISSEEKRDAAKLKAETDKLSAADKKDIGERGFGGLPVEVDDGHGGTKIAREDFLLNKNGKPVLAATKEEGTKLREQLNATRRVIDAVDNLRQIRRRSGWTSDLSKNADWQSAKAEFHNAILGERGTENLSRLSEADINQYKGLMGELEDPTRWNGIEPGLKQARAIAERNMAHALNAQPGNDVDFHIADPLSSAIPTATKDDDALKNTLSDPERAGNDQLLHEYNIENDDDYRRKDAAARNEWMRSGDADRTPYLGYYQYERWKNGGLLPSQSEYIGTLADVVSSRDDRVDSKARKDAATRLGKIAAEADSQLVRDAAQRALAGATGASIPAPAESP